MQGSEQAVGQVTRQGMLFALIGPTGSGKSTHIERIKNRFGRSVETSISVTSRPMRGNEQNGVHYYFISRAEFEQKIEDREFFEWEEVHGNYYGTLLSTVTQSIERGVDLLLDIDIRGALTFRRRFPKNTVCCFLIPPSFETLVARVRGRSPITFENLVRRVNTAEDEYLKLMEFGVTGGMIDYFVVNDNFELAADQLAAIIIAERVRISRLAAEEIKKICTVGEVKE